MCINGWKEHVDRYTLYMYMNLSLSHMMGNVVTCHSAYFSLTASKTATDVSGDTASATTKNLNSNKNTGNLCYYGQNIFIFS